MPDKRAIVIAEPNGAGKATFARGFLPNEAGYPIFVNADLIAAGLSPFAPEKAANHARRLMLEEIHFVVEMLWFAQALLAGLFQEVVRPAHSALRSSN